MSDYIDSYYTQTLSTTGHHPGLNGTRETQVCVVGGGLAGLSSALGLGEKGIDTVLVETNRVGWGASGRNGGFVGPGFSLSEEKLIERVGLEDAKSLYRLSREGAERVRHWIDTYEIDCGPVVEGGLRPSWFDDREGLERRRDFMDRHFDAPAEFWPRDRVREALRTERYYDALFKPEEFQFHPLNYTRGIAAAAVSKGVEVFEQSPVLQIDLEASPKIVRTTHGQILAEHVVLTCGGYLGSLIPKLRAAIVPVATYVIATEPLGEESMRDVIRVPYSISDNKFANDYYRRLADTRILWGGRISVRQSRPPDLSGLMRMDLAKIFPQLEGIRIESAWHGLMSYAVHKMPQIGSLSPKVWFAMGFGGSGMNTTNTAGDLIASAIADGDDRYRLFAPFGLTPTGGPLGAAAAQLTYWYLQTKDVVKRIEC